MKTPVKQARSDATRKTILDSAERLFGANGIEPTPVTEVAAAAGRAVGSVYNHFADKAGLVDAVVDRILDDLEAEIDANLEPVQWHDRSILDIVSTYVTVALGRDRERPGTSASSRRSRSSTRRPAIATEPFAAPSRTG